MGLVGNADIACFQDAKPQFRPRVKEWVSLAGGLLALDLLEGSAFREAAVDFKLDSSAPPIDDIKAWWSDYRLEAHCVEKVGVRQEREDLQNFIPGNCPYASAVCQKAF